MLWSMWPACLLKVTATCTAAGCTPRKCKALLLAKRQDAGPVLHRVQHAAAAAAADPPLQELRQPHLHITTSGQIVN